MNDINNNCKIDFVEALPEEISILIFSFVPIEELRKCASCSKSWRRLVGKTKVNFLILKQYVEDDSVWFPICEQRWCGKQNMELTPDRVSGYLKYNKSWKVLYHEVEKDSTRDAITKEELCKIKWKFFFMGR